MSLRYISLLICILSISVVSATSFSFVYPTPSHESIYNSSEAVINVTIYQDYPLKNCTLILRGANNEYKLAAQFDKHTCWRQVVSLKDSTYYKINFDTEDMNGTKSSSQTQIFFVDFDEEVCDFDSSLHTRNCVSKWLSSVWTLQGFLIGVIILALLFALLEQYNHGRMS